MLVNTDDIKIKEDKFGNLILTFTKDVMMDKGSHIYVYSSAIRDTGIERAVEIAIKYIRSGEVAGSFSEGCRCKQCNLYAKKVRNQLRQEIKQAINKEEEK